MPFTEITPLKDGESWEITYSATSIFLNLATPQVYLQPSYQTMKFQLP